MLQTRFIHIVLITLSVVLEILCKNDTVVKIVLLKHLEGQNNIVEWYENAFTTLKTSMQYETIIVEVDDVDEDKNKICNALSQGGTVILDVSWHENDEAKDISTEMGVPYIRIDVSIGPMLSFLDSYLDFRNSTDVAIVFEDPTIIDQALHYWIDTTRLRLNMVESLDIVSARKLKEIRPIPKNYALIASTQNMTRMFSLVVQEKLVFLPDRWHLVFLDFRGKYFDRAFIGKKPINLLLPNSTFCCQLLMLEPLCICPENFNMQKQFLYIALETIVNILEEIARDELELTNNLVCNTTTYNEQTQKRFQDLLAASLSKDNNPIARDNSTLKPKLIGSIEVGGNGSRSIVATFEEPQITLLENKTIKPIKSFYRVGVTHALPWSYKVKDPVTDITTWAGYCIDFTAKLSQVMNFDYELVEPKTGTFGEKTNGRWDGVVGDLASGDTDLAITALIMTADREEIIDFVAPYFEQTGITILMRKPVRKTSLFKFMTVLKLEVWLSIVVALVVTGFMVWFLDKYSPYSARNNKKAYPYPCREFTLKESFWFALTSFTPQGGGEAPKALSGRTLVAAYWLFVVLMLATFTANLAAFLTVERMQAPVQSLEQLARQSRINYTVVKNSDSHLYFINMKFAEDTLYRMWKELTLNASTDDARYRVWDYPIKEQYGHILLAINDSDPVATAEEGFRNVNEHLDADYALIHDSSEIRYEISKNCNFTEVGEVFGEKPYAVAIQQGSHLQDDISRSILKLQKERFFESLQAKYWNHSAKGDCPSTDDNEGITLESLGGVFIATLFGLGLAMITLAGEVLYYRRKRKIILPKTENSKLQFPNNSRVPAISKSWQTQDYPLNFGTTFKPVNMKDKMSKEIEEMKLSHINLYPRARNRITQIQ